MKLQDKLPDSVIFNGKRIKLDLDFRNVIRMIETLAREDLTPEAREYLAMKCICKRPATGMLVAVKKLLFPQVDKEETERITDFEQDADLIRAAFMQAYGIDLFTEKVHWFKFSCLLSGLPSGCRYSEILNIRSRPIPTATKWNADERNWLIKAKSEYAIKLTDKEIAKNYNKQVGNIGHFLLTLAGEGVDNNG
jgi:hypothetical protein